MEYTENLHLKKPEQDDFYDIQNENDNMDILDEAYSNAGGFKKVEEDPEIIELPLSIFNTNENKYKVAVINTTHQLDFRKLSFTRGHEVDKPETGIYYTTDTDKFFKDGEEIEVNYVDEIPEPSEETKGKYYVKEFRIMRRGIVIGDNKWLMLDGHTRGYYEEGLGFKNTGGNYYGIVFNYNINGTKVFTVRGYFGSADTIVRFKEEFTTVQEKQIPPEIRFKSVTEKDISLSFTQNGYPYVILVSAGDYISDVFFDNETIYYGIEKEASKGFAGVGTTIRDGDSENAKNYKGEVVAAGEILSEFNGVIIAKDTGEPPSSIPTGYSYETYEVAE